MRYLLALAFVLVAVPCRAQAVVTYLQNAESSTDATSYTFSAQNIGTATSDRCVVVVANGRTGGVVTATILSVTVQGIDTPILRQEDNSSTLNTTVVGIAAVTVPTGTTGDVVVTFNITSIRAQIALYALTGSVCGASDTDFSEAMDPVATIDVPENGAYVAAVADSFNGSSATWTNATENYEDTVDALMTFHGASGVNGVPAASIAITCNLSSSFNGDELGIFVAFGPSTPDVEPPGGGGFPQVVGTPTKDTDLNAGTSHTFDLPTSMVTGRLVLLFWGGGGTDATPNFACTGWTVIEDQVTNSSTGHVAVAYRFVDGSEGATVTCTGDTSETGTSIVMEVSGAHLSTAPEDDGGTPGGSTTPNSGSLDPGAWGTENTMWISVAYGDGSSASITAFPTGFDNDQTNGTNSGGSGGDLALATREEAAASVDPAAFTSTSVNWAAVTVGVRPAAAVGGGTGWLPGSQMLLIR